MQLKTNKFHKVVKGFSKLSKTEKIEWLLGQYFTDTSEEVRRVLSEHWHQNNQIQELYDSFSENTLSNFILPLGIAPNFLIDGKTITVPMVTEESSVVAAASAAAKFWSERGGFKTTIHSTIKSGQVHFNYDGTTENLQSFFTEVKSDLIQDLSPLSEQMKSRGGGVLDIELINETEHIPDYYQLNFKFETADAMGANFINSCLEQCAQSLEEKAATKLAGSLEVIMSILSNYTPECLVTVEACCPISEFNLSGNPQKDAEKFVKAIEITKHCKHRATTHNKGIMNGIDAVAMATGNDFRAIEANAHTYACKDGCYKGLSHAKTKEGKLYFWMELPLAIGTVGGIISSHPLVKMNLAILGNLNAKDLMRIIASVGLAQNFSAVRSLITTGIQKGHMKMHLSNILNEFNLSDELKIKVKEAFKKQTVSYSAVKRYLKEQRLIDE